MSLKHINPEGLPNQPAFSQGVQVTGRVSLVAVGGRNGVDADDKVVSPELAAQTEQAFRNVLAVLAEAGASQADVIRLTICVVAGQSIEDGFVAAQTVWGEQRTAITVLQVAGLARPDCLVEIDALVAVPLGDS